jgi:hypothetical protein
VEHVSTGLDFLILSAFLCLLSSFPWLTSANFVLVPTSLIPTNSFYLTPHTVGLRCILLVTGNVEIKIDILEQL